MLILSQNKKRIVNLNNITNIYCNGTTIFASSENIDIELGDYSSTSRCKEILQEILAEYQRIKNMSRGRFTANESFTYYMPEE